MGESNDLNRKVNRIFNDIADFAETRLVASTTDVHKSGVIKASAGTLYTIFGYNTAAARQFIQLHDAIAAPSSGAVPVFVVCAESSGNFSANFGTFGLPFATGISWTNSSVARYLEPGSSDCFLTATYI
jgi:hypothetical protein